MKTVKVYFDHDAGWTNDDFENPDLCGPWIEIPEALFDDYLEAQDKLRGLSSHIRRIAGRKRK